VQINLEENALKALLIKLFMPSLRKTISEANWGRYFIVRRGITDEIKDAIGLLNTKVGYTYLLDGKCKIRWAGSGLCEGDEKDGLVKGTRRLIEEARTRKTDKRATANAQQEKGAPETKSNLLSDEQAAPAAAATA